MNNLSLKGKRPAFITSSAFGPEPEPIGGAGSIISAIAEAAAGLGAYPVVAVDRFVKNREPKKKWFRKDIPVYRIPFLRSVPKGGRLIGRTRYRQLVAWLNLEKAVRLINPEIIYFNIEGSGRLRFAYEIKRRTGARIIGAAHGLPLKEGEKYFQQPLGPYWIESVESVDVWVPCGPLDHQRLLMWGIPEQKIEPIYNGVEIPKTIPEKLNDGSLVYPKVLYVGRVLESKGVIDLAESLVELTRLAPELMPVLQVAGACEDEMVRKIKEILAKAERKIDSRFFGEASQVKVKEIYIGADIFCHPTKIAHEGLPLTILEAAAFGCPMILSDHPAHRSVFMEGNHALFFEQGNTSDLAGKMIKLMKNEDLRHSLRKEAYLLVKEKHDRRRMTSSFINLFERLLMEK